MKVLRNYQNKAVDSLFDFFMKNKLGSPLLVIPVGGGKSLIMAEVCKRVIQRHSPTRILILAHVAELLTQTAEEVLCQYPDANLTFYSASLKKKDLSGNIVCANIQSIHKKVFEFDRPFDLVLIDEAQLVSPR